MKREPKARTDGICAQPGCGKPLKTVSPYGQADAFCSTGCCKQWYGVSGRGLNS